MGKLQEYQISAKDRKVLMGHDSFVIWLTGLSGSGKSSIANLLENQLHEMKFKTYILDGDNLRNGLNKDLGFSAIDRSENIRRAGEVAKLLTDAGIVVIANFISPISEDRRFVKSLFCENNFVEVFVKCPVEECIRRDTKGLYAKAKSGTLTSMVGVDFPYEEPVNPNIVLETNTKTIDECVKSLLKFLESKNLIGKVGHPNGL